MEISAQSNDRKGRSMISAVRYFPIVVAIAGLMILAPGIGFAEEQHEVSFSRDILPMLSDRCFLCHGPDEKSRESEFRLDIRKDATRNRDGSFIIKPGNPGARALRTTISRAVGM